MQDEPQCLDTSAHGVRKDAGDEDALAPLLHELAVDDTWQNSGCYSLSCSPLPHTHPVLQVCNNTLNINHDCSFNCACPAFSPICVGKKCQACSAGLDACGGACRNYQTDPDHCEYAAATHGCPLALQSASNRHEKRLDSIKPRAPKLTCAGPCPRPLDRRRPLQQQVPLGPAVRRWHMQVLNRRSVSHWPQRRAPKVH